MKTPCILVCIMDKEKGFCTGCGRTLEEIANWSRMDDAERERIMKKLSGRGPFTKLKG